MRYKSYSRHVRPKRRRMFRKRNTRQEVSYSRSSNGYKPRFSRNKISGIATIIVLIVWAGVLVFHPYFKIQNIKVDGIVNIKKQAITEAISTSLSRKKLAVIPQANFFAVDLDRLKTIITTRFPVQSVSFKKTFPKHLSVTIEERLAYVIHSNGAQYSLLDEQGIKQRDLRAVLLHEQTIRETRVGESEEIQVTTSTTHYPDTTALQVQFGQYPVIYNKAGSSRAGILIDGEVAKAAITIQVYFKDNLDFATHHFIQPREPETLIVENAHGMRVSFNPYGNLTQQLDTFSTAWKKELRSQRNQPIVVNARYTNRVYVEE